LSGVRVLLVDDHRMFAEALEMLLGGEDDIEVVGVLGSASEALELASREHPDVALVDIELPDMSGIEATSRLKEISPSTQVVAVTAHLGEDVVAEIVEAGASGFIAKTQAAEVLVSTIRRAAAGEMVLPSANFAAVLGGLRQANRTRSDARQALSQLTSREVEILQKLAEGRSTQEVAKALFISPLTVHSYVKNILAKLSVRSKLEAVTMGLRYGRIGIERAWAG